VIDRVQDGSRVLYVYKGPRDTNQISLCLRAQVLYKARGRCGDCGRTIEKHGIVLSVDHIAPREWGGGTVPENLWAVCEDCNAGKNRFDSIDAGWMRQVMRHKSVHFRLGETLKAFKGQAVPAATLGFVASQDDWKKRIRELRYLGWEIDTLNRKIPEGGRSSSLYRLVKSRPWPADPTGVIRQYERDRAERNRSEDEE
jgi:hypothetical protein